MTIPADTAHELDVRGMRKPDKHPTIFAAYGALPAGGSFILINDHDPKHLHDEFDVEEPGGYSWEYLKQEPRDWRIRITKLTSTPLPRVLVNTSAVVARPAAAGAVTPVWTLQQRTRDLDANVISLGPDATIDTHIGPDIDVLIHVIAGTGTLGTETGVVELAAGQLVWLPRRSQRRFGAGPHGLCYLTVHQRRQALVISPTHP
ncbi:MAG TPA: DUF2249 domain-containing protein [Mycobacteriales bacterium]|nr:DUF2249 domain-containing protein [Mycobacteriales bacterium]